MTPDELLAAVASEPNVQVVRDVRAPPRELLERVSASGGMRMSDFVAASGQAERRTYAYGHVLDPGLTDEAMCFWEAAHPAWPLPADLRALVLRVNGVHPWANLATGRAYQGLAPLHEWRAARETMFGADADAALLDDDYLALSYHQDHGAFVVLDVRDGAYFLMDPAGPDRSVPIGTTVAQLLRWLWGQRLVPG